MSECAHTNTETRKMSHCNQIKLQCLDCGMSVGHAIKHSAIAPEVLATIEEFDSELRERKWKEKDEARAAQIAEKELQGKEFEHERKAQYHAYLNTPQWREKRDMVIDREQGVCQGCRKASIREVHHSTYSHLGDELLFQLVGLCSSCHRKAHPEHNP